MAIVAEVSDVAHGPLFEDYEGTIKGGETSNLLLSHQCLIEFYHAPTNNHHIIMLEECFFIPLITKLLN